MSAFALPHLFFRMAADVRNPPNRAIRSPLCHPYDNQPNSNKADKTTASAFIPPWSSNIAFLAINCSQFHYTALNEQTYFTPPKAETRGSNPLGCASFQRIFGIFYNGLEGNSLPREGSVTLWAEVLGHLCVTRFGDKMRIEVGLITTSNPLRLQTLNKTNFRNPDKMMTCQPAEW